MSVVGRPWVGWKVHLDDERLEFRFSGSADTSHSKNDILAYVLNEFEARGFARYAPGHQFELVETETTISGSLSYVRSHSSKTTGDNGHGDTHELPRGEDCLVAMVG